jgi:hypothetical protein
MTPEQKKQLVVVGTGVGGLVILALIVWAIVKASSSGPIKKNPVTEATMPMRDVGVGGELSEKWTSGTNVTTHELSRSPEEPLTVDEEWGRDGTNVTHRSSKSAAQGAHEREMARLLGRQYQVWLPAKTTPPVTTVVTQVVERYYTNVVTPPAAPLIINVGGAQATASALATNSATATATSSQTPAGRATPRGRPVVYRTTPPPQSGGIWVQVNGQGYCPDNMNPDPGPPSGGGGYGGYVISW